MTATRKAKAPPAVTGLRDRAQASRAAANRVLQSGQPIESATLPPACGVSRMGERLAEAYAEYLELDALPTSDKDTGIRLRMRDLDDVLKELREAIS